MACGVQSQIRTNLDQFSSETIGISSTDRDVIGLPFPVAFSIKGVNNAILTTGQYESRGKVENLNNQQLFVTGKQVLIDTDQGKKRVLIEKFEVLKPVDGKSEFILKFQVIDNFLPLVPVFWTVAGITGLTAGGFFFTEVNKFTQSSAGTIISIVASIAALIFLLK